MVLNVSYINTRAPSFAGCNIIRETWYNTFLVIYSASLLAPPAARTGPMDLWGNVTIPRYVLVSKLSTTSDEGRQIPQSNYTPTYTSPFGIPVS